MYATWEEGDKVLDCRSQSIMPVNQYIAATLKDTGKVVIVLLVYDNRTDAFNDAVCDEFREVYQPLNRLLAPQTVSHITAIRSVKSDQAIPVLDLCLGQAARRSHLDH